MRDADFSTTPGRTPAPWWALRVCVIVLSLALTAVPSARGQADQVETFYHLVNQQRLSEGYAPRGRSRLLDQAAGWRIGTPLQSPACRQRSPIRAERALRPATGRTGGARSGA